MAHDVGDDDGDGDDDCDEADVQCSVSNWLLQPRIRRVPLKKTVSPKSFYTVAGLNNLEPSRWVRDRPEDREQPGTCSKSIVCDWFMQDISTLSA